MTKPDEPREDVATATTAGGSTRERIVEATVELMAEIGIDRVRTRTIAERAGVNPALVHYHFGSIAALVMEAAEYALLEELGPSIDVFVSAATVQQGVTAILEWIEQRGQRTPGATILAEAMVKATRDPEFRRWTKKASRRFRAIILERLETARANHEIDPALDIEATAVATRGGARRTSVPPPGRPEARRQTNRRADRPDARSSRPVLAEERRYETAEAARIISEPEPRGSWSLRRSHLIEPDSGCREGFRGLHEGAPGLMRRAGRAPVGAVLARDREKPSGLILEPKARGSCSPRCAINRLRNKEGTGHGRRFVPNVSAAEAQSAIRSMGLVSQMLLDRLAV